ncbi:10981_t:CDS:2, partial [Dentiscutata heterogama]
PFVYTNDAEKRESTELSDQPIKDTSRPTALTVMATPITRSTTNDIDINASRNGNSNILELERDIGIQLSDSKSVRLFKATEIIKGKLAEADEGKLRAEQEKIRLQNELDQLR